MYLSCRIYGQLVRAVAMRVSFGRWFYLQSKGLAFLALLIYFG